MSNITGVVRPSASIDISGDPLFIEEITVTTPGTEQTLITQLVPASKKNRILKVTVTCNLEGTFRVFIDSDQIASGRTGPGVYNAEFDWRPYREVLSGETIYVKFEAMGSRPATDVEAYFQGRELPA